MIHTETNEEDIMNIGDKVYFQTTRAGVKKAVLLQIDGDDVIVRITNKGKNAWPYKENMHVQTSKLFIFKR